MKAGARFIVEGSKIERWTPITNTCSVGLRQTSDVGSGRVFYRVTADKLYKLFDSLNPV
jgi:hypothetical protein